MTSPQTGFNLVDDPWIELGERVVSIRDALLSGHELPGWPSGEPAAGPVIIRLLMPIVYRVTAMDEPGLAGRRFAERQARLLQLGRLDLDSVESYLERHRDRFWLTGPPDGLPPFAQDPALAALEPHPPSKLVTAWASGNNPTLGPHASVAALDLASAARCLLITHNYSSGGLHTKRPATHPGGKFVASRLRRSMSIHPVGSDLAKTLIHHLVPAPDGWETGRPLWEAPQPTGPALSATPRTRAGLFEQLAGRHDKTVLLVAGDGGEVSGVVLSAGPGREPGLECPDPYIVTTVDGGNYQPRAGRDVWRDIDALVIQSKDVKVADRLEAKVLAWCRNNGDVGMDPGRWALVSHRSVQSKEHGWDLVNLPDIIGLFPEGGASTQTASAVIAAAEDLSTLIGKVLSSISHDVGSGGGTARYDSARSAFWSRAEHTFWQAVTAEAPNPTADAPWVRQLRLHALAGFDAATAHLTQTPRTHLAVERWRSSVSRWTWPRPSRSRHQTKGQTTT